MQLARHLARKHLVVLFGALVFCACSGPSCRDRERVSKVAPEELVKKAGPDRLVVDATWTLRRLVKAKGPAPEVVPPEIWGNSIRELKPIRVYRHGFNVVVVLKESDAVEEGIFIPAMQSSYIPTDGRDGFSLKHIERSIYSFKRRKSTPE